MSPQPSFSFEGTGTGGACPHGAEPQVLTVTQLTARLKGHLEPAFSDVWVLGEAGKVSEHPSGVYFSLKDETALIECVVWRREARRVLRFDLETGAQVVAHGYLDLYAARGQYKLVVDRVEPKGVGALQKRFEQLKKKLAEEGLFAESRKRPIPFLPRRIGVVTSRDGAAIQDILKKIFERFPRASVVVRPSLVQGEKAAPEIARAISELNEVEGVEVMIVGRGGGSLEDLWAFNEEIVARAIAVSRIPVVSAVGHEYDYTIADLVADRRAKTPTEAGEIVVPELRKLREALAEALPRMERRVVDLLGNCRGEVEREMESLVAQLQALLHRHRERAAEGAKRLAGIRPDARLARQQTRLASLLGRLAAAGERKLSRARERFVRASERLEGRSPVAILARGYSLTRIDGNERYLADAEQVRLGERIETTLHRGRVHSRVERIDPSAASG